jgi:hypothetical protein
MQSFFGHFPASEFFNSHRPLHSKPPRPGSMSAMAILKQLKRHQSKVVVPVLSPFAPFRA